MGDHHHHSGHNSMGLAVVLNIAITIAQGIAGFLTGSLALMSDALHNLSDVLALCLSYLAQTFSGGKYSSKHTFGFKRAETMAALINAVSLIAVALFIIKEGIERFGVAQVIDSKIVIIFAILGIAVNWGSAIFLKKGAEKNLNIRSAYLHLLADALASFGVLIGGVSMALFDSFWIDSVVAIAISVAILVPTMKLLLASMKILMQFSPDNVDLALVEQEILKNSAISSLHHVHIWQLSDEEIHLEAHLDFRDNLPISDVSTIIEEIRSVIYEKFSISHCVFQPEHFHTHSLDLVSQEHCEVKKA